MTKFVTLKALEDKSLSNFYAKLREISNQSFALGEEYANTKLVCKVLSIILNVVPLK